MLISCASRKVNKEVFKKDSLVTINSKTVTKEDIKIETKNDILIDEFTITPLDSLKDITINGISYKNVVLRYKKTKDNSLHIENKMVSNKEFKTETLKVTKNTKVNNIDKKANYFVYLWLLIIPIIYFIFKLLKSRFSI